MGLTRTSPFFIFFIVLFGFMSFHGHSQVQQDKARFKDNGTFMELQVQLIDGTWVTADRNRIIDLINKSTRTPSEAGIYSSLKKVLGLTDDQEMSGFSQHLRAQKEGIVSKQHIRGFNSTRVSVSSKAIASSRTNSFSYRDVNIAGRNRKLLHYQDFKDGSWKPVSKGFLEGSASNGQFRNELAGFLNIPVSKMDELIDFNRINPGDRSSRQVDFFSSGTLSAFQQKLLAKSASGVQTAFNVVSHLGFPPAPVCSFVPPVTPKADLNSNQALAGSKDKGVG